MKCRASGSFSHANGPATAGEVTTFANYVHSYLRQNVSWADQKAAFIFAAASGFIAYLNTKKAFAVLRGDEALAWHHIILLAGALCIIVAAFASFVTYWPRTKGASAGLVFWGAIAKNPSAGAYVERVKEKTAAELAEAKLEHTYELAKICRRKFWWVDVAGRFGVAGFALAMLYVLLWL